MIIKTKGVIFQNIKYSETSLILKIYTEDYGLMSFIYKGARKMKKKSFYGHLAEVEITAKTNENRQLHFLNELTNTKIYRSVYDNMVKSSVLMFCNEILINTIKEEESNEQLFLYIQNAINCLDEKESVGNFILSFLIDLSSFLGFCPSITTESNYFDLREGVFCSIKPCHDDFMKGDILENFIKLLSVDLFHSNDLKLSYDQRMNLLESIIAFYQYHIPAFKTLKSLTVIREVFR